MSFTITETGFKGLLLLKPQVFGDHRGYFMESYNQQEWKQRGIDKIFVQDNQSRSAENVLRGLHFQKPPYSQAKVIRVIKGKVLDVVVDLRTAEPTYGQSYIIELSEENFQQLYIPEGFAHGFYTMEDTILAYKCSDYYMPEFEDGIMWNDPDLHIDWHVKMPLLSEKDKNYKPFSEFKSPF